MYILKLSYLFILTVSLMDSLDSTLGTKYNSQEAKGDEMKSIPEGTEGRDAGESESESEAEAQDDIDGPETTEHDEGRDTAMDKESTAHTSRGLLKTGTGKLVISTVGMHLSSIQ